MKPKALEVFENVIDEQSYQGLLFSIAEFLTLGGHEVPITWQFKMSPLKKEMRPDLEDCDFFFMGLNEGHSPESLIEIGNYIFDNHLEE